VSYELPADPRSAVRVHLRSGDSRADAYVHPQTLQVLKVVDPDSRLTEIVKTIHGELFAGKAGSIVVELAACWAIVMVITGLYLWWPRNARGLAGVLYPRLRSGKGTFWRDLHAVTGLWVSALACFLLLTALPWTTVWGGAFKSLRSAGAPTEVKQDWATAPASAAAPDEHAGHRGHSTAPLEESPAVSLDVVVAKVAVLNIAPPVLIQPPTAAERVWAVKGESQNRPLRRDLAVDSNSGEIVRDRGFAQRQTMDRVIGIGISAHEGQLFGLANQLLGLAAALGLLTLCVSGVVLWWRNRPAGELGLPAPKVNGFRIERGLAALIVLLAILLPVFGASLVLVAALDRLISGTAFARALRGA
jgi:uncharacterized iron-regulated membrane protein